MHLSDDNETKTGIGPFMKRTVVDISLQTDCILLFYLIFDTAVSLQTGAF